MKSPIQAFNISYQQQTLMNAFTCIGQGLHTGARCHMTVMPADADTGYRFVRKDVPLERAEIVASWHSVVETHLSTTVGNFYGTSVQTIEHLMAALRACGIDNARIILNGPELPILDGSARTFVELIRNAGRQVQDVPRHALVIKETVTICDGDKSIELSPFPIPWVDMRIDFDQAVIGKQRFSTAVNESEFVARIASARTFGLTKQLETLRSLGYVKGGNLDNAVLVDDDRVVNREGLRYQDEFVRHKVMDCIGDLALSGAYILGRVDANCSGHKLNNKLLREVMLSDECYEYMPLSEADGRWPQVVGRARRKGNILKYLMSGQNKAKSPGGVR